jgi:hypothetical protein
MLSKLRSSLSFANVAAALALVVAMSTGAAYAAGTIFSEDIVNGEVKKPDIDTGAVNSEKVANDSLVGADIDESTLRGVNATTLNGHRAASLTGVAGARSNASVALPDCAPGVDYMVASVDAPGHGWLLVTASFTASHPAVANNEPVAARIEFVSPSSVAGEWQEANLWPGAGRTNIAMTEAFEVSAGTNTFVVKACDSSDFIGDGSGAGVGGEMTFAFSPFQL